MKRMTALAMAFVCAASLTGCGTAVKETTAAETAEQENIPEDGTDTETENEEETEEADAESGESEVSGGLLSMGGTETEAETEKTCVITGTISTNNLLNSSAEVSEDTKYGAATISLSQEEFEADGFTLGDSCNVTFGNGYVLTDVPYFNGYYVKNGEPVIVAYPGFSNISITFNNQGIWEAAGLSDGDSIEIELAEAGRYAAIQEVLGQQYSFDRKDYTTDEEFCNFRALSGGNLKENFLYRGASPVDNSRCRAAYTNALLEKTGIQFVMDLADSETDMEGYIASEDFASEYTKSLYEKGSDALLSMGSAYQSDAYRQKVAEGVKQMLNSEGPVYIHCMEGKDRTGFVCCLFEALAGASYEEMRSDYLMTYWNYYKVSEEETPEKYDAITDLYFDAFVSFLHGTEDHDALENADYSQDAAQYLMDGGLTADEVEAFKAFICK